MASAFHCGSAIIARLPLAGNQRALTRLFSAKRRVCRRGETQEGTDFFLLRFSLCADAGAEALDFALFQAEVSRRAVREEVVTMRDEMVVQFVEELLGGSALRERNCR